jgi:hypothetical protein
MPSRSTWRSVAALTAVSLGGSQELCVTCGTMIVVSQYSG